MSIVPSPEHMCDPLCEDCKSRIYPTFGTAGSADNMTALGYRQPDPAPLPEEVESVRIFRQRIESYHLHDDSRITIRLGDGRTLLTYITAQARRLAEAEAELDSLKCEVAAVREIRRSDTAKNFKLLRRERESVSYLNRIIRASLSGGHAALELLETERDKERHSREAAEARVGELEVDNREVTREMLCIKAERDALRERCEKLEWLVEVQEFYMYRLRNPGGWSTPGMEREKIGVAWQRRSAANDELRAMYLAATEVKP